MSERAEFCPACDKQTMRGGVCRCGFAQEDPAPVELAPLGGEDPACLTGQPVSPSAPKEGRSAGKPAGLLEARAHLSRPGTSAPASDGPARDISYFRKMAFAIAKRLQLTPDDRHGLAAMLLLKDVGSWAQLDEADYRRLADALRGYELVAELRDQNGAF